MKLAELKGSEKQIAWAKDIRDSFIRRYETLKDKEIEEAILIKADVNLKDIGEKYYGESKIKRLLCIG